MALPFLKKCHICSKTSLKGHKCIICQYMTCRSCYKKISTDLNIPSNTSYYCHNCLSADKINIKNSIVLEPSLSSLRSPSKQLNNSNSEDYTAINNKITEDEELLTTLTDKNISPEIPKEKKYSPPTFVEAIIPSLANNKSVPFGKLFLTIHSAKNIPKCQTKIGSKKANPYLLTGLTNSYNSKAPIIAKSKCHKKVSDAHWEEKIEIEILDFQEPLYLKMSLMDKNEISTDEKIKDFYLDLKEAELNVRKTKCLKSSNLYFNKKYTKISKNRRENTLKGEKNNFLECDVANDAGDDGNLKNAYDEKNDVFGKKESLSMITNYENLNLENEKILEICNEEAKDDNIETLLFISYYLEINSNVALLSNICPKLLVPLPPDEEYNGVVLYERGTRLLGELEPAFNFLAIFSDLLYWVSPHQSWSFLIFLIFCLFFLKTLIFCVLTCTMLYMSLFCLMNYFRKLSETLFLNKLRLLKQHGEKVLKHKTLTSSISTGITSILNEHTVFKEGKKTNNFDSTKPPKQVDSGGYNKSNVNLILKTIFKLLTISTSLMSGTKESLLNLQILCRDQLENVYLVKRVLRFEDELSPVAFLGIFILQISLLIGRFGLVVKLGIIGGFLSNYSLFGRVVEFCVGVSKMALMYLKQSKLRREK